MSGRAHPDARERYEGHLRVCADCRRVHRVLHALYEGPETPRTLHGIHEEREFQTIMRRTRGEDTAPWYQSFGPRVGIAALSAVAGALALSLFNVTPDLPRLIDSDADVVADTSPEWWAPDVELEGGIDHPAQSYGRIVGGSGEVTVPGGQAPTTNTFAVGTHFTAGLGESLQVGLVGKIVANFTAGSDVEWTTASPSLLELNLNRGLVAVRYDRRPSDPMLHVRTPTALIRVMGTVFTVQVDQETNTVVSVLDGEVQVHNPENNRLLAEVEAGYRFDVSKSTFADVGRAEVSAALPLSSGVFGEPSAMNEAQALADARIPPNWNVPGLPTEFEYRTLARVPMRVGSEDDLAIDVAASPRRIRRARVRDDEGEYLIEQLVRDAEATRRKELSDWLELCRELYYSPETRYRSARCLSGFMDRYGDDPRAVEGYLLVGILRMDYALDHRAADVAFGEFLRRAPGHPRAELAMYRLWLSSTEEGRIAQALERGQRYLERYPNGKYVGKILQRFPELYWKTRGE
jgi:hypothetical protein